jgi:Protein of unknown function (DUF998)
MTTDTARYTHPDQSRGGGRRRAGALLVAGAVAGPLFTVVVAAQTATRDGFDLTHQPLSLLSLGDLGWIQIGNFVVTGVLMVAMAAGLRPALSPGTGSTWGPLLTAVFGIGLVAGGVFLPDPALGYPPGTPDAVPDDLSWHGLLHAIAPPLAFTALVACCLVLARRFAADRERAWALYSGVTAVTALVLSAWPSQDGASVRLAAAALVGFAWTTAVALHLRRRLG